MNVALYKRDELLRGYEIENAVHRHGVLSDNTDTPRMRKHGLMNSAIC